MYCRCWLEPEEGWCRDAPTILAGREVRVVESKVVLLLLLSCVFLHRRPQGRTRKAGTGCGWPGFRRDLISPIFKEALKIAPTGTNPANLWAATAASPIEAMQPHDSQSGFPPNWQGVTWVLRSADIVCVVNANTHSCGLCGGEANCRISPSGMSNFRNFWRNCSNSAMTWARSSGVRTSGNCSPFCGVKMLNQIFSTSGRGVQNSRNSCKYPGRFIICPVTVQ